jgi:hypothetical protein
MLPSVCLGCVDTESDCSSVVMDDPAKCFKSEDVKKGCKATCYRHRLFDGYQFLYAQFYPILHFRS